MIFLIFLTVSYFSLDPDFGWRLTNGRMILTKGFPRIDPYSYTMQSYPYVDGGWAVDVLFALAMPTIGKFGLSVFFSLAALCSLLIASKNQITVRIKKLKNKDDSVLEAMLLVVSSAAILPFMGVRVQILSWLMFSLLLFFLSDKILWKKYRIFTPLFFVIWVNLHGSFPVGFAALALFVVVEIFQKNKDAFYDLVILGLSGLAVLVNPYGVGMYREAITTFFSGQLHFNIQEWLPSVFYVNFAYIISLSLFMVFYLRYKKVLRTQETFLVFMLLFMSISSVRHIPLWIIVFIPTTTLFVKHLKAEVERKDASFLRYRKSLAYAFLGIGVISASQWFLGINNSFLMNSTYFYPKDALVFLNSNEPKGNLFSSYGWGGYIVWNYPQKKVFIDGRMAIWKQKKAPQGQSKNSFEDYINIVSGTESYQTYFDQYEITAVMLPTKRKITLIDTFEEKLTGLFLKKQSPPFDLLEQLKNDGWDQVYQDNVATVLSKE